MIFVAGAAILFASFARRPLPVFVKPGVDKLVELANHYRDGERGKAAFLPQWHLLAASLRLSLDAKARWVGKATWAMVFAVALLLLPLIVSLCVGGSPPIPAAAAP